MTGFAGVICLAVFGAAVTQAQSDGVPAVPPQTPVAASAPEPLAARLRPPTEEIGALLAKLARNAAAYRMSLPSLACHEHIVSQEVRDGKVQRAKEVDTQLRVTRVSPEKDEWIERRAPLDKNGMPRDGKGLPHMPYRLTDGFVTGEVLFTKPDHLACLDMSLDRSGSYLKLSYVQKPEALHDAACPRRDDGLSGYAMIDRDSSQIVRTYRTVPESTSKSFRRALEVEQTYAPVRFDAQTFMLTQTIVASDLRDRHYTATYRDCKRFASDVRILDSTPLE